LRRSKQRNNFDDSLQLENELKTKERYESLMEITEKHTRLEIIINEFCIKIRDINFLCIFTS
jgi:hypothetical protein